MERFIINLPKESQAFRKKRGDNMVNTNLLKGIRVSRGYTQKPVAEAAGMNVTTYCQKEQGKVEFTPKEIELIASFLNINIYQVNEIFFDKKLTIGKDGDLKQSA
jgi:transcriptional regulator with XRE-family HTH domain